MPDNVDDAVTGRSNPSSLPGWIRPIFAAIGLGFLVASVGGPDALGRFSSISPEVLWVSAASAVGAGALMGWFALQTLSSSPPEPRPSRGRAIVGRFSLGFIGIAILLVSGIRALTEANPIMGSVIFGAFAGLMLVGTVLPTRAFFRPSR